MPKVVMGTNSAMPLGTKGSRQNVEHTFKSLRKHRYRTTQGRVFYEQTSFVKLIPMCRMN